MVAIYAVIILSMVFVLFFIGKIIDAQLYIMKKEVKPLKIEKKEHKSKKAIVKKSLVIILTKKKVKLRSKVFYARFLNEKSASKIPVSIRFLIDEIYLRVSVNAKYIDYYVDYDRLRNAGIFNEKPIFKIEVKDRKTLEKTLKAIIEVYKYLDFRTIFLLDEKTENNVIIDLINESLVGIDYKIVLMRDINIKLLYEINKLNLNFTPQKIFNENDLKTDFEFQNIELNRLKTTLNKEEFSCNLKRFQLKMTKFLNFTDLGLEDSKVSYYMSFLNNENRNKIIKFSLNYRLKNDFFNIKMSENNIVVDYADLAKKNDIFHFSNPPKNYDIIKFNKEVFIKFCFHLTVHKDSIQHFFLIPTQNKCVEIDKNELVKLVYNSGLNVEKYFNFKLYIKNNEFNEFFNNSLKKLIIEERLNQNKFSKRFFLPNKICQFFYKTFNCECKKLSQISSYFELYNFIVKDIFGIALNQKFIYINPQKNFYNQNFKFIFIDELGKSHNIYISQNSEFKGLEVNGIVYANLKVIDLNLIEGSAKFCV